MKTTKYFYDSHKVMLHNKANINRAKKDNLCLYCYYFNLKHNICTIGNKLIFNKTGCCKKYHNYQSTKHSDDSDRPVNSFVEYATKLKSVVNPVNQMQDKIS